MTPFQEVFLMYLAIGLPFGFLVTFFASRVKSLTARLPLCLLAVLIVWLTLFLGVTQGYDAWQALPNPPEEAFADGGGLTGVVIAGWLPAGIFVAAAYVFLMFLRKFSVARRTSR
ncbi:MAG: hypothetical protein VCA55_03865 [Verrucomicrobiales bacterium]